jgi:hypothetical protein
VHTKIICLCGSTRFTDEMLVKQWELTKKGYIVLSWCALPAKYYEHIQIALGIYTFTDEHAHIGDIEGVKGIVDEVHKRKIDLADIVYIMNVGGYVGKSTKEEIRYAIKHDKDLQWLEVDSAGKILLSLSD